MVNAVTTSQAVVRINTPFVRDGRDPQATRLPARNAFPDHGDRQLVEVVLMVGIAGSGKTTYSNDMFLSRACVSLDINQKSMPWDERTRLIERYEQEDPLGL